MDKADLRSLYRQMLLIRRFEEKSAEMYALAKIAGFLHLYIGEEAIAVGAIAALPDDYVIGAYRDHGHCLARGSDRGKGDGRTLRQGDRLCHGKGGSMHLVDLPKRFMGGYAIVGVGDIPLGRGISLRVQNINSRIWSPSVFGEGALCPSGQAHEAFNLAALWKLPVIFICENNRYGTGTPVHRDPWPCMRTWRRPRVPMALQPSVDGMDVLAVRAVDAQGWWIRLERGAGPYFIEAMTYRFMRAIWMADLHTATIGAKRKWRNIASAIPGGA